MSKRFGLGANPKKEIVPKLEYNAVYYSELEDILLVAPDLQTIVYEANVKHNKEATMVATLLHLYNATYIGEL